MTPDEDAMRRHPLATRQGITTVVQLIEADEVWRRATKPQKRHLTEQCADLIHAVEHGHVTSSEDLDSRRPTLKGIGDATRRSMQEKGLLDAVGRVTPRAMHATFWMTRVERAKS